MAMGSNLVFLCGFPSSGTDLLKNILNAHPDIFIGGEFPFLPTLWPKYGPAVDGNAIHKLVEDLRQLDIYNNFHTPNITISPLATEYSLGEVFSRMLCSHKKKWKGNKTPQNTENIAKLKKLFPHAKFILIVRDVRDVALSWKKKWGKDQLLCASKWDVRMRHGHESMRAFEDDCLIVKYESLLDNFEATARGICSFLQIEFHVNMLEYDKHVNEIIKGKLNYGKPVLSNNHGKWRKEMATSTAMRIEEIAYKSLKSFRYAVPNGRTYRRITTLEKYLGFARDAYALLFVGNTAIKENSFRYRVSTVVYELRKIVQFRYSAR
jgi:hypothetical protein